MRPIKKLEIITDAREMLEVIRVLERHGVRGYSLLRNVVGKGERGVQSGDELSGAFTNSYLLSACSDEVVAGVLEDVRALLKRSGGVCLVSDALWVEH